MTCGRVCTAAAISTIGFSSIDVEAAADVNDELRARFELHGESRV